MESLKRTGFFVIPEFVEVEDCVSELKQRVMQCKKRRFVFQGARHNDNRRIQAFIQDLREEKSLSKELETLLESVAAKLRSVVPSRPVHEITVLVSLEDCSPQRLTQTTRANRWMGSLMMGFAVACLLE